MLPTQSSEIYQDYQARKVLMENELIIYQPGVKGKAATYQIRSLVSYFEDLSPASSGQMEVPNPEPFRNETRNIYKERERDKQDRGGGKAENAYTVYEQNFGIIKPIMRESLLAWCDDLGDAMVIDAIKLAARKGGRTYIYLSHFKRMGTSRRNHLGASRQLSTTEKANAIATTFCRLDAIRANLSVLYANLPSKNIYLRI